MKESMALNEVITIWERLNIKSTKWEHNHISDGYSESEEKPTSHGSVQEKNWSRGQWRKFKGHLEGIKVIVD